MNTDILNDTCDCKEEWICVPKGKCDFWDMDFSQITKKGQYLHYISSKGRVIKEQHGKQRFLKQTLCSGYLMCACGNGKTTHVHNLVSTFFLSEKPDGFHTDHIDGNTKNNCKCNLRFLTPTDNNNHPIRRKRISKKLKGRVLTELHRERMKISQQLRRERERKQKGEL